MICTANRANQKMDVGGSSEKEQQSSITTNGQSPTVEPRLSPVPLSKPSPSPIPPAPTPSPTPSEATKKAGWVKFEEPESPVQVISHLSTPHQVCK